MIVKARKVGDSVTFTVPKNFKINAGQKYNAQLKKDGTVVYYPLHRNPFEGHWYHRDLHQTDIWGKEKPLPSEWPKS